jgi:hypothetical protein
MTVATLPGVSHSFWGDVTQLQEVHIVHPYLFALSAAVFMAPAIAAIYRLADRRGVILAIVGLLALALAAVVFVEIFTPILREARGEAWRTSADDTSTRDLFLIPTLFTILPALSALLFRPGYGLRIGMAAGLVYWIELALVFVSDGRFEIGAAIGGLVLCLGIGAVMGRAGARLGDIVARRAA